MVRFSPAKRIVAISNGKPGWLLPSDYSPEKRRSFLFFAGNSEPEKNPDNRLSRGLKYFLTKGIIVPLHIAGPGGWKNREFIHYCKKAAYETTSII